MTEINRYFSYSVLLVACLSALVFQIRLKVSFCLCLYLLICHQMVHKNPVDDVQHQQLLFLTDSYLQTPQSVFLAMGYVYLQLVVVRQLFSIAVNILPRLLFIDVEQVAPLFLLLLFLFGNFLHRPPVSAAFPLLPSFPAFPTSSGLFQYLLLVA